MTAEAQFTIHRENMIKAYDDLLKMLTQLDRTDPELKEKYRERASKIVENMTKTLEVWPPVKSWGTDVNRTYCTWFGRPSHNSMVTMQD